MGLHEIAAYPPQPKIPEMLAADEAGADGGTDALTEVLLQTRIDPTTPAQETVATDRFEVFTAAVERRLMASLSRSGQVRAETSLDKAIAALGQADPHALEQA